MEPTLSSTGSLSPGAETRKRSANSTNRVAKTVTIRFEAADAESVAVAGSFNGWSPDRTPMTRGTDGTWTTQLQLPPSRYEYRLVVDGAWQDDPHAAGCVANPFGGTNCVLVVD